MAPRLFWSPNSGREKQQNAPLNATNNPVQQSAEFVTGADIVYPPPGGGLLRVPVGGGQAAEMLGSIAGQLPFWSASTAQWQQTLTGPSDGQMPSWDAATGQWVFIPRPTLGSIQYFDNTIPAVGLWNFNGNLNDISGNGNNLALEAGNLAYADITPGKQGLWVLTGTRYSTADNAPALILPGDMSVLAIVQRDQYTTTASICTHAASGETAPVNQLYDFRLPATATDADLSRMFCGWEQGAGVDVSFTSGGNVSLSPIHNIGLIGFRRLGNVVRFYSAGLPFGPDSGVLAAPTGGTDPTTRFLVGAASPTTTALNRFLLMSLKVYGTALTDAEVKAEYNRTLGPAFGNLA